MKTITFEIKDHADRIKLIEVLREHGYKADLKIRTEYSPHRYIVTVKVDDCEVED